MMVQRGHEENPAAFSVFALGALEMSSLDDDGKALHEEDAAKQREYELLADEHCAHAYYSANGTEISVKKGELVCMISFPS